MNTNEKIPINRLKNLRRLNLETYMKLADLKEYKKNEVIAHFRQIKNYIKDMIKAKGEMKKLYKHSEASDKGRLYSPESIQGLDAIIRGYLFRGITTDIDQVNSHPVLLRYICKINLIRCPILEEYVNNRDEILEDLKNDGIENGKTLILKIVNSEKTFRTKNEFIKDLTKEIKKIRGELLLNDEYNDLLKEAIKNKPNNITGSFINRLLCYYENEVLQLMINHINHKGFEIACLSFDGLLIYGDAYDSLLGELEAEINDCFDGMNMKLKIKEHSNIITDDILETLETISEDLPTYEIIKEDFELNHAKIINKGMYIHIYNGKVFMKKRMEMFESYEHMKFLDVDADGNEKAKQFINAWLIDSNIRKYTDLGIYPPPLECPNDVYNLWTGFDMEHITDHKEVNYDIITNHIKILCNNEENVADYIIKWLSQMVQYPAIKTKVPTFISKEGAGKSWLIKLFRVMFGNEKVLETSNPSRDVWGDFNGLMMNAFIVNLNEISKRDTMEAEGKLKSLVTEPTIPINMKGKNQFEVASYHRFINTTNSEEPINSKKDDRRNLIIRCSDEKKGDYDYFNKLFEILENKDAIKSFFEYLKSIPDMDKFNSIPIPITEYHEELKELSRTPIELFIINIVEEASTEEVKFTSKELYDEFKEFIFENKIKYEVNSNQFHVRLKRNNIEGIESKKGAKGIRLQVFNIPLIKQTMNIGCMI
tara:strand:+ start:221 stop:2347 length:2127 start_codon:yes stop_codon:yes gene_type:complete